MKPVLKKIIAVILIGAIGYGVYFFFFKKSDTTKITRVTATVTKGTIENAIKTTGTAQLVNEQKIRFNQAGSVTAIYFKEGDQVKKGQIIAEIDKTSVYNTIKQQQIALNNSKLTLLTDQKPPEAKDILQSQNSVDKTQLEIETQKLSTEKLKTEYDNKLYDAQAKIDQKKVDIESKKNQLTLLQNQLATLEGSEGKNLSDTDVETQKTLTSAYIDARKYLIDAKNHLKTVDDIFAFTSDSENEDADYLMFLSAKSSGLKETTKTDFLKSKSLYEQYDTLYSSVDSNTVTSTQLIDLLEKIGTLYDSFVVLGKDGLASVNASVPSLPNFGQSTIDGHYSTMNSLVTQSQSSYSNIKTTIATIKKLSDPTIQKQQSDNTLAKQRTAITDQQTSIDNAQSDLKSLENNLELTKQDYENQFRQADITLQNLESTLALNKANLEYIKKGATEEQIQRDKNDIARQQLSLEDAMKNLDKYEIEAPFDGILRQIDFKVGDNIVSDDIKYVYIDNPNIIEITAQLDQIDIAKVQNGQEVKIDFDSFTESTFTGSVTQINSSPISTSGVTSYEIKIGMDKGKYDIYSGMTAKIQIIVNKKEDVLLLPSEFITTGSGGVSTVLSVQGKKKEVVVGMTTSSQSEIVSGLEEGDKVVRLITTSAFSTTSGSKTSSSSSSSSRRSSGDMGGGMGGPPGF